MFDFLQLMGALDVPLTLALVLWFLRAADRREASLSLRIQEIETKLSTVLTETVRESNRQIATNSEVLRKIDHHLSRLGAA